MLKDLAQIFESDKRSKLVAECPEFGMPGASAYLALVGGDYNRAREEILAVHQCFKEQVGASFVLCVLVCLLHIAAAACCFPFPASRALRHACKLPFTVTPSEDSSGHLLSHIRVAAFASTVLLYVTVLPRGKTTAVPHSCPWISLQTAQHVHQLEAALQDAQQAKEQAEVERDGAVAEKDSAIAESVQLTLQKDEYENMVQDLVKENVAFKAETAVSQLSS